LLCEQELFVILDLPAYLITGDIFFFFSFFFFLHVILTLPPPFLVFDAPACAFYTAILSSLGNINQAFHVNFPTAQGQ
jgi:hypothetical protein